MLHSFIRETRVGLRDRSIYGSDSLRPAGGPKDIELLAVHWPHHNSGHGVESYDFRCIWIPFHSWSCVAHIIIHLSLTNEHDNVIVIR